MNNSEVSGFLESPLAEEIQNGIFLPWIKTFFNDLFPLLGKANLAHIVITEKAGLIETKIARKLRDAVNEMDEAGPHAIPLSGALEDIYFNYEAELIRRVGHEIGGRLHIGRSRNDLYATLDRMRARYLCLLMLEALLDVRKALLAVASKHIDTIMPGYTHQQHAQPITYGFYLLGVEQSLQRDFRRLLSAYEVNNQSPLGSGALAGTPYGFDRVLSAQLLGFDEPVAHTLDAVATRDSVIEILTAACFLSTSISRLAQDFYFMTTHEVRTLSFPDSFAITSSLMPQKKNLAVLEFMKGRPSHLIGALVTAFSAYRAAPFSHALDSNADSMHWLWPALREMVDILPAVSFAIKSAAPDTARMRELAGDNFSTTTDLADYLVDSQAMSFKDAHQVAGRVVRTAMNRGITAHDIDVALVAEVGKEMLNRTLHLDQSELAKVLDPSFAISRRVGCGGTAARDIQETLERSSGRSLQDRHTVIKLRGQQETADDLLCNTLKTFN